MEYLTLKSALRDIRSDERIPLTAESYFFAVREFRKLWIEKAQSEDWMQPIGVISVGSCNFGAITSLVLFGGSLRANREHTWVEHSGGRIVDLSGYDQAGTEEASQAHATYLKDKFAVERVAAGSSYVWRISSIHNGSYIETMHPENLFVSQPRMFRDQEYLESLESVVPRANAWGDIISEKICRELDCERTKTRPHKNRLIER